MKKRFAFLLWAVALCCSAPVVAAQSDPGVDFVVPKSNDGFAEQYNRALQGQLVNVERLYRSGEWTEEIFLSVNNDRIFSIVLNDREFPVELIKTGDAFLPGYKAKFEQHNIVFDVDATTWRMLAEAQEDRLGAAYFAAIEKHFPKGESSLPDYFQIMENGRGCVDFLSDAFLAYYYDWKALTGQRTETGFYSGKIQNFLSAFRFDYLCSCNSKEETIIGLMRLKKKVAERGGGSH